MLPLSLLSQTLYLSKNQLTGTLDPAWELPESLSDFQVAYNNFTGLLPAWNLPNLKQAALWGCNFTGEAGGGNCTVLQCGVSV